MHTLTTLRDRFDEISKLANIPHFRHGYVSEINDGGLDYPLMLLTPFKNKQGRQDGGYKYYDVKLYILDLNQEYNNQERDMKWEELENNADEFVKLLFADFHNFALIGQREIEFDADSIGNDSTLWVELNFTMKVKVC